MKSPVELAVHRPYAAVLYRAPVVAGRVDIPRPCLREVRPRSGRLSSSDTNSAVSRDGPELVSDALRNVIVAVAAREAFFRPLVDLLSRLSREACDELDLFVLQPLKNIADGVAREHPPRRVRDVFPDLQPRLIVRLRGVCDHFRGDLARPVL